MGQKNSSNLVPAKFTPTHRIFLLHFLLVWIPPHPAPPPPPERNGTVSFSSTESGLRGIPLASQPAWESRAEGEQQEGGCGYLGDSRLAGASAAPDQPSRDSDLNEGSGTPETPAVGQKALGFELFVPVSFEL